MVRADLATLAGHDDITPTVHADLGAREQIGIQRYGTPLQAHNGRCPLWDAYEEALDLACYLMQARVEGHTAATALYEQALHMACQLRRMIRDRQVADAAL